MKQYLELLTELQVAAVKDNRTGISAASKFGHEMVFDLSKSIPLLSTKQVFMKPLIGELLCFIKGSTNAQDFRELGCNFWNANANSHGTDLEGNTIENKWLSNAFRKGTDDLGPIYGAQWRNWDHTIYFSSPELIELASNNGFESSKLEGVMLEYEAVVFANNLVIKAGYEYLGLLSDKDLHVFRKKVDQLAEAVKQLRTNPLNRRILVSGWNPGDMDKVALPPCHVLQHWQCEPLTLTERIDWAQNYSNTEGNGLIYVPNPCTHEDMDAYYVPRYKLNLFLYQRSADTVLGIPYNIASYAIMNHIMCRMTNHVPGVFKYYTGDTHIYGNHGAAVEEQLCRVPINNSVTLKISDHLRTLEDFETAKVEDFVISGYEHCGKLESETPMAI